MLLFFLPFIIYLWRNGLKRMKELTIAPAATGEGESDDAGPVDSDRKT
jgi:hypothetical protein